MALAAQALAAKKASNPCEQGEALEGMAARIERLMGLTFELSGGAVVRLERFVSVTSVHAVFDVESSAHLHNHQVSADYFEGTHAPKAAG